MDQDIEQFDGYVSKLSAVVEAQVVHNAPCVPECPVCYPEGEDQ